MHRNFNVGFGSSHKNEVHLHLSQWHYWWWFWFALIWSLYFLVILRAIIMGPERYKNITDTPSHSKENWMTLLTGIISLGWFGNIFINSNFILRMIKWQDESSLFNIYIQGKQWYWVSKYDPDIDCRKYDVYWNVGNNNWYNTTIRDDLTFQINNSTLFFIYEYEFQKAYKRMLEKMQKTPINLQLISFNTNCHHYTNLDNKLPKWSIDHLLKKIYYTPNINDLESPHYIWNITTKKSLNKLIKNLSLNWQYSYINSLAENSSANLLNNNIENLISYYISNDTEYIKKALNNIRTRINNFPLNVLEENFINSTDQNFALLNYSKVVTKNIVFPYFLNNDQFREDQSKVEQYWNFKEKKYKKVTSLILRQNYKEDIKINQRIKNIINDENLKKYNWVGNVNNNTDDSEIIPITLSKRLLRTKQTLILPIHTHLHLIASSNDAVYSWSIPKLRLKIDGVPGRTNHSMLYIEKIGFYYGQCTEINGQYHHHMPIRVCALSYEKFLLWWQTVGLPKIYKSEKFLKKKSILLSKFKD